MSLKTLILKNLILIEEAHVDFQNGLTIITGETGAGKTALIEAIRLILGERSDATKVRKGCERAVIQAAFDGASDEDLIISREIFANGKSRAFVAGEMVPAAVLQKLAPSLVDFIGQHAQISLKNTETQRTFLDLYAQIDLSPFQTRWDEEKQIQAQLEELERQKSLNQKLLIENQLGELDSAQPQEGEDEVLFEEYALLSNSQELLGNAAQILTSTDAAIDHCVQIEATLASSGLEENQQMAKEAHFQLAELRDSMHHLKAKIESDPGRLTYLEERLKMLDQLKKKYGKDLLATREELKKKLEILESLDERLEALSQALARAQENTQIEINHLREKRTAAAQMLEKELSKTLQELNIPTADVRVEIVKTTRSKTGEDEVRFMLRANKGEQLAPIKECSSGGELSRFLFALKIALAEKNPTKTLIFDEIDANVGGETATIIGKKLRDLGECRQVFCITHFPQVARYADHHLRVHKEENEKRTLCQIEYLNPGAKEIELLRMLGGAKRPSLKPPKKL
ncbi:MAG: DNA repair protein RecN [Chlamydiae bacterium]|nr:DNA repair protein RecN [Chlamydiota bacterium]